MLIIFWFLRIVSPFYTTRTISYLCILATGVQSIIFHCSDVNTGRFYF